MRCRGCGKSLPEQAPCEKCRGLLCEECCDKGVEMKWEKVGQIRTFALVHLKHQIRVESTSAVECFLSGSLLGEATQTENGVVWTNDTGLPNDVREAAVTALNRLWPMGRSWPPGRRE